MLYIHNFKHKDTVAFAVDENGTGFEYSTENIYREPTEFLFKEGSKENFVHVVEHSYVGDWKDSLQLRKNSVKVIIR